MARQVHHRKRPVNLRLMESGEINDWPAVQLAVEQIQNALETIARNVTGEDSDLSDPQAKLTGAKQPTPFVDKFPYITNVNLTQGRMQFFGRYAIFDDGVYAEKTSENKLFEIALPELLAVAGMNTTTTAAGGSGGGSGGGTTTISGPFVMTGWPDT